MNRTSALWPKPGGLGIKNPACPPGRRTLHHSPGATPFFGRTHSLPFISFFSFISPACVGRATSLPSPTDTILHSTPRIGRRELLETLTNVFCVPSALHARSTASACSRSRDSSNDAPRRSSLTITRCCWRSWASATHPPIAAIINAPHSGAVPQLMPDILRRLQSAHRYGIDPVDATLLAVGLPSPA